MSETIPKEKLYKTAYCPLHKCFVGISHAYKDVDGNWLFYVFNETEGLKDYICRDRELRDFVL